jgi:hypothetical protein
MFGSLKCILCGIITGPLAGSVTGRTLFLITNRLAAFDAKAYEAQVHFMGKEGRVT